ncbi:MAG: DNA polymerase III subunit gamma/tau [Cryomorphaceae bacterium]|nr:DNA polymerase III subunit gamma/tau [Cryomorphaceae bacterium]
MDQPYIVSARKYRPKDFEAVVGQAHVTETLEHEVASGHLAQALLFCGPRGVGKTTCARILARRINEVHTGPDQDYSLNIFELDAASNNSVDDIRQLIDQVRFAPQVGQYKVYIIDEVHMLSQAAFNAFLKTLEEPPAHAIFILATTEKHKVLPTILSRCQIFDFKRIGLQDISNHLAFVAEKEGITAEEEALHAIAEKADGALRDSLSIFDRVAAFARGGSITYDLVRENLQLLDRSVYFESVQFLMASDTTALLLQVHHVMERGFDLHRFLGGLASHLRDVLLAKHEVTVRLMDVPESVKVQYRDQAQMATPAFLAESLKILSQCDLQYRASSNPRLLVEIALLEMAGITSGRGPEKKKPNLAEPAEKKAKSPADREAESHKIALQESPKSDTTVLEQKTGASMPPDVGQEKTETKVLETGKGMDMPHDASSRLPTPATLSEAFDGPEEENVPGAASGPDQLGPVSDVTESTQEPRKRRATFSLKANLSSSGQSNKKQPLIDTEDTEVIVKKVSPFSQNALETAWLDAVKLMEDRPIIYAVISKATPVLEDDFRVRLSVENRVQADYLEEVRDELVATLRSILENDAIRLQARIEEGPSNARIVYTPEERFQFLLEKNPYLAQFREEFKLDLE